MGAVTDFEAAWAQAQGRELSVRVEIVAVMPDSVLFEPGSTEVEVRFPGPGVRALTAGTALYTATRDELIAAWSTELRKFFGDLRFSPAADKLVQGVGRHRDDLGSLRNMGIFHYLPSCVERPLLAGDAREVLLREGRGAAWRAWTREMESIRQRQARERREAWDL